MLRIASILLALSVLAMTEGQSWCVDLNMKTRQLLISLMTAINPTLVPPVPLVVVHTDSVEPGAYVVLQMLAFRTSLIPSHLVLPRGVQRTGITCFELMYAHAHMQKWY